jgi:hypothetical protein
MRVAGINWVAVLIAAVTYVVIGYVIHLQLVDLEAWDAAKKTDQAALSASRMAAGLVLPLITALGLAVLFKWGHVASVGQGVKWAVVVALTSAVPALWYNWFYGDLVMWTFWVDSAHQLFGHAAAGAILSFKR